MKFLKHQATSFQIVLEVETGDPCRPMIRYENQADLTAQARKLVLEEIK